MRGRQLAALLAVMALGVCACARREVGPFGTPAPIYLPVVISRSPTATPTVEPVQVTVRKGASSTYDRCAELQLVGAEWYYDWGPRPALCPGVEAVPMLWGKGIYVEVGGDSKWLMGFNEPELSSQANITPTLAAQLWREIEQIYPDKKLVSPATVYLGWLTVMWNEYQRLYGSSPRIDAVGIHCWQAMTAREAADQCKRQVTQARVWADARGIPEVWCTEWYQFSCFPEGMDGAVAYLEEMLLWLEEHTQRHSWFQVMDSENWFGPYCETDLVRDGQLTDLGKAYAR